jgi:NADPH2:quinone reductase
MKNTRRWTAKKYGGPDVLEIVDKTLRDPVKGEVTIDVKAIGMNPADYKHIGSGRPQYLPIGLGYEVAGVISAIGHDTEIASAGGKVGDEVIAAQINNGYSTVVNVKAANVFAKPKKLNFAEAANLILVGATAADMINAVKIGSGDVVLLHGASGAVGNSAMQQALLLGAKVLGTASKSNLDKVKQFGGIPVEYGDGLLEQVRKLSPGGVDAVLDTVGNDEAVEVSIAVVKDLKRYVTITAADKAKTKGFLFVGGSNSESGPFRASKRSDLIKLAAEGKLVVPMAETFPFENAKDALTTLMSHHPSGTIALLVN